MKKHVFIAWTNNEDIYRIYSRSNIICKYTFDVMIFILLNIVVQQYIWNTIYIKIRTIKKIKTESKKKRKIKNINVENTKISKTK